MTEPRGRLPVGLQWSSTGRATQPGSKPGSKPGSEPGSDPGQAGSPDSGRTTRRLRLDGWSLWVLPFLAVGGLLFVYPAVYELSQAFTSFNPPRQGGLDNFSWFVDDAVNRRILLRTLGVAVGVSGVCVLLGFPYAYTMVRARPAIRSLMAASLILPSLVGLVERNFAWLVILQRRGVLNEVLIHLGMGQTDLLGTSTAVFLGLSNAAFPFMVLPLYAALRGIDLRVINVACSLGAPPWRAFLRVYLPSTVPGIVAGFSLAFVFTLGAIITPLMLGSPQQMLIAQLIDIQVRDLGDFGTGGAAALVLCGASLLVLGCVAPLTRVGRVGNGGRG